MSLLTFPLALADFFDLLPVSKLVLDLPDVLDVQRTKGGTLLTSDLGDQLWSGKIDLSIMTHDEVSVVRPLINLLRRGGTSFLVSDLTRPWPRSDTDGVIIAAWAGAPQLASVGSSGREVSLSGLPPNYVLSRGDLISWTYGSSPLRYALHELVGTVEADSTGATGLVEINPPVRPGAAAGNPVTLRWPVCQARLVPGQNSTGTSEHTITTGATLSWQQMLRG